MLPPESATLEVVARETGIGTPTLERWRGDLRKAHAKARTAEEKTATFDISQLERNKWLNKRKFKSAETRTLYADDALTRNTMENPDAIKREDQTQTGLRIRDEYSVTAQPWSFVEVILD